MHFLPFLCGVHIFPSVSLLPSCPRMLYPQTNIPFFLLYGCPVSAPCVNVLSPCLYSQIYNVTSVTTSSPHFLNFVVSLRPFFVTVYFTVHPKTSPLTPPPFNLDNLLGHCYHESKYVTFGTCIIAHFKGTGSPKLCASFCSQILYIK
jgi:hypothetical protein